MDTTRVEIIGKQLEKVVDTFTQHSTGLTTGEVALLAAIIGASAAILAQLIVFLLTRSKERGNLKRELVGDERRIAYLLTEFYKELVMHKVHKMYWYRASEIRNQNKEDSKDNHERHFVSNQRSFETLTRVRVTTSEYFKIVTHFTNLTGENEIIFETLDNIRKFQPRKASTFDEVNTYEDLLKAQNIEENELNKVYLFYSQCYDKINYEMTKKM